MSLYSALNTSVTGMAAQANKLSVISENISNSSTIGYKEGSAQFEDLISQVTTGDYNAIGVTTNVRYDVTGQGSLNATTSNTDLAIQGNGFFVVQGTDGSTYLTRAGSFTKDDSGNLVNTAGFSLKGYALPPNGAGDTGSIDGLSVVNLNTQGLNASPTTTATLAANLPSTAAVVTTTPTGPGNFSQMTSLTTYNNLGAPETLNLYFTKIADSSSTQNTWNVDVYNAADTATSLGTATLQFDPTTGSLSAGDPTGTPPVAASPTSLSVSLASVNGGTISIDLSKMTQVAGAFSVTSATADGNPPSSIKDVSIAQDGTLSFVYANGKEVPAYKIPLANVESPDNLTNISGDVFQVNAQSGQIVVGTAGQGGMGAIDASNLEASTVDLAGQLTDMIQAQRGYEANSKVFQAGSDLLSTLINTLK